MKKTFIGKIISLKMHKTAVIEVVRKQPHPLYRKLIKKSSKFKADTGELNLVVGQRVKITQTKPISKDKFFVVTEVIK